MPILCAGYALGYQMAVLRRQHGSSCALRIPSTEPLYAWSDVVSTSCQPLVGSR
jgi:hypothetical protein